MINNDNNFKDFKNIGESVIVGNGLTKKNIEYQVDLLLKNKQIETIVDFIANGYVLNENQHNLLYKDVGVYINDKSKVRIFNLFLVKNLKVNDEMLIKEYHNILTYHNKMELLVKHFDDRLKDNDFKENLFNHILNEIKTITNQILLSKLMTKKLEEKYLHLSYTFTAKIETPLKFYAEKILDGLNLEKHVLLIDNLEKMKKYTSKKDYWSRHRGINVYLVDTIIDKIQSTISNNCKDELENSKKNIQLLFAKENLENDLLEKSLKEIKTKNIKSLPVEALNILDIIEKEYIKLLPQEKDLTEEIKYNLRNLWDKRLPEVIGKFLSIDTEYRTSMKNIDGKNAQELMIESLESIKNNIKQLTLDSEDKKLTELSATNRYIKAIKLK